MRTVRLAVSAVAAAALIPLTAVAAFAAPPANDTPEGAIALTLGQTVTEDTTQATTDQQDASLNRICGAPFTNASVWYSYTPAADGSFELDMSKSDYSGGFMVFAGAPTRRSMIACGPTSLALPGTAGTTYTVMVFSDTRVNGGNLVLSLKQGPPPPQLTVTIDPVGQVSRRGKVTLTGTFTCQDTQFMSLNGRVSQIWRRVKITGFFHQRGRGAVCDGQTHAWTQLVASGNGLFAPGLAAVHIHGIVCGELECVRSLTKQPVMLKRGTPSAA